MYTPLTKRGERYRTMGYWFATGYEQSERDRLRDTPDYWHIPDRSQEFGDFCAEQADFYENGQTHSLQSIPDLYRTFKEAV